MTFEIGNYVDRLTNPEPAETPWLVSPERILSRVDIPTPEQMDVISRQLRVSLNQNELLGMNTDLARRRIEEIVGRAMAENGPSYDYTVHTSPSLDDPYRLEVNVEMTRIPQPRTVTVQIPNLVESRDSRIFADIPDIAPLYYTNAEPVREVDGGYPLYTPNAVLRTLHPRVRKLRVVENNMVAVMERGDRYSGITFQYHPPTSILSNHKGLWSISPIDGGPGGDVAFINTITRTCDLIILPVVERLQNKARYLWRTLGINAYSQKGKTTWIYDVKMKNEIQIYPGQTLEILDNYHRPYGAGFRDLPLESPLRTLSYQPREI